MKNLVVRLGATLYPLLTSFALANGGCGSVEPTAQGDDTEAPTPDAQPDGPTPPTKVAGALDESFGDQGILELPIGYGYAGGIAVQGDKLVVCVTHTGNIYNTLQVHRFTQNGYLDTTFGTNGEVILTQASASLGCADLEVAPDGHILVVGRFSGGTRIAVLDANGTPMTSPSTLTFGRVTALPSNRFVAPVVVSSKMVVAQFDNMLDGPTTASTVGNAADAVRAFQRPDGSSIAVGRFSTGNGSELDWRVLASGTLNLQEVPAYAKAGTAANDLLNDAAMFADGSVMAVGGVDGGTEVMTARWVFGVTPSLSVEHHPASGPTSAAAITIDSAQRAVVVGQFVNGPRTMFAWQRYAPSSNTLDATYQDGGGTFAAAPMGNGELVDAVTLNGAIYAIGSFATESATPRIALLKINE